MPIPLCTDWYSSSALGIMVYINPIIAFAVAVRYFDEVISVVQLYGYLLLLFSIFLFNWKAIKNIFT